MGMHISEPKSQLIGFNHNMGIRQCDQDVSKGCVISMISSTKVSCSSQRSLIVGCGAVYRMSRLIVIETGHVREARSSWRWRWCTYQHSIVQRERGCKFWGFMEGINLVWNSFVHAFSMYCITIMSCFKTSTCIYYQLVSV
jgi:hypothetical protein